LSKPRLYELDFVRAICALGIVIYHFSGKINETLYFPFYAFKNGYWGRVLVTCFFILSGMTLYYHNSSIDDYKLFFVKRIKSIYPSFYLVYIPLFFVNAFLNKSIFWKGNPLKLVLSILGVDGYFYYITPNYYIIGEWFLGAIILLYILYPLIVLLVEKTKWVYPLIVILLYVWQTSFSDIFAIDPYHNLISCVFSFSLGIYIMKYELWNKIPLTIVSFILFVLLVVIKIPFLVMYLEKITGISLFFVLSFLGVYAVKNEVLKKVIKLLSAVSYEMFLVHHVVILLVVPFFKPNSIPLVIVCMFITVFVTIIGAFVVNKISKELIIKKIFVREKT